MNISSVNSFRSNLYTRNNQSKDDNIRDYGKQNISFSGLKPVPKAVKPLIVLVAAGLTALIIGGNATKNKSIPFSDAEPLKSIPTQFSVGDVTYKLDLNKMLLPSNAVSCDMEIETALGKLNMPATFNIKDMKTSYDFPTGRGDISFVDTGKSTLDTIHGNLIIKTKSGEELKFPYTKTMGSYLKLDDVYAKMVKNVKTHFNKKIGHLRYPR